MGYYCGIFTGQSINLKGKISLGRDAKPAGLFLHVVTIIL
jgi:hypothetical protein